MTRPSPSAASASMPPLAGWRRDLGRAFDRRWRRGQRPVAPQPVIALEGHQPRAVGQARHALGIGLRLARDQPAVEAVQLADARAAQPREIGLAVILDGGGEPGALVGDRGQGLAVGRDVQVRPAAEMARVGRQHEAAAPHQAADDLGRRVVDLEGLRGGPDLERLLLRHRRRRRGAGAGGGEQADDEQRAEDGAQVQAARRPDLPAGRLATFAAARRARRTDFLEFFLVEQLGELLHHRAAELLGVDDGDGAAVVARHVVADADGDQLDRRARLDPVDDVAQVALEVVAGIDRQRRIRRPARRRRSPSGSGAPRCAAAGGCAPTAAPRRRCSP